MKISSNRLISIIIIALSAQLVYVDGAFRQDQCLMCRFSVSMVNYALRTSRGADLVFKITNTFCRLNQIQSPLVCEGVTRVFNSEIVKMLSYGFITPDQICGLLSNNTCGVWHNPLEDWEVNLEASTKMNLTMLSDLKKAEIPQDPSPKKPFRIVQLSDTHVDLEYQEGSPSVCGEPLCCRNSSTPLRSTLKNNGAGYWGSLGACDVPLRTLDSALEVINATIAKDGDIDYIIWTGDIQAHNVWEQNKKSASKTYDTVFSHIFKLLPGVRIFPTLGNHEMVPVDSFTPSNLIDIAGDDSPEWLYRKLDSFWSRWLPDDTVTTLTKDGFYATQVRPGLKLVSLNTNFCHNKNFWLYINSTDPGNQLEWLIHELQMSELLHEQVHIIGHIPPGAEDCLKVWSKNS